MYGPLEYVLFQFDDDRFISEILPALIEIEQRGCAGLVDIVFVIKDEGGDLEMVEIGELAEEDEAAFEPLRTNFMEMLSQGDVAISANSLPENSYGAVLLFEHRWALELRQVIHASGGQLLDSAYINPQTQAEILAEMMQMEADGA
jgi:hypothetical protein